MKHTLLALLAALASTPTLAVTCESLQAEIETKIRSAGVKAFTITVADAEATLPGKVVGSCAMGRKKLVYTTGAATPAATASAARPGMVTECKDGSTVTSGSCRK
jgi:hypothetical protein